MGKFSWYTNPVKVTDYLTVYQYAVDREILIEKRKDGSQSFILIKKGTYVTRHDGGWQRYKPNMKGSHRHNHVKNAMARRRKCKKGWRNCAVCGARFYSTHHNIFCSKYCAEL